MRGLVRFLARWGADRSGIAAIEFAALAPVMLLMMVASLDLSGALRERMAIGHILRAGAQVAMADPGTATVRAAMVGAAQGFTIGTTAGPRTLTLVAQRLCACPGAPDTVVGCTTICTGSQPTYVRYSLQAEKLYDAALVPDMRYAGTLEVQLR